MVCYARNWIGTAKAIGARTVLNIRNGYHCPYSFPARRQPLDKQDDALRGAARLHRVSCQDEQRQRHQCQRIERAKPLQHQPVQVRVTDISQIGQRPGKGPSDRQSDPHQDMRRRAIFLPEWRGIS